MVSLGLLLVPVHAAVMLYMPHLLGEALDQLSAGSGRAALAATCWLLLGLAARPLHHERVDHDVRHRDAKRGDRRRHHRLSGRVDHRGERGPRGGPEDAGEDEVGLAPIAEDGQPVGEEAVHWLDHPRQRRDAHERRLLTR